MDMDTLFVADFYSKAEAHLAEDAIIVQMAVELRESLDQGRVQIEQFIHASGRPRWHFIQRCANEYRERGGTIDYHVGGPARAVLMVLGEKSSA